MHDLYINKYIEYKIHLLIITIYNNLFLKFTKLLREATGPTLNSLLHLPADIQNHSPNINEQITRTKWYYAYKKYIITMMMIDQSVTVYCMRNTYAYQSGTKSSGDEWYQATLTGNSEAIRDQPTHYCQEKWWRMHMHKLPAPRRQSSMDDRVI